MKIQSDLLVELDYVMLDEDGEAIESSADEGPMLYVHGGGNIPPELERALDGAEPGAQVEVTLEPGEAFGDYDPEAIVSVPRSDFPPDHALEEGEWLEICVSDEDAPPELGDEDADDDGLDEMQARVVEFDDETVVLDTNHPLAGRRVTFRVAVRDVRVPTEDDLRALELADRGEDDDDGE